MLLDDRDEGLACDLRMLTRRRQMLAGAGASLAGALWGGPLLAQSACLALPEETAGPFPADGTNRTGGAVANVLAQTGVERDDLRQSFDGMTAVAEGVVLEITLTPVSVAAACAPLAGHAVYLWHCDAEGAYSIYERPDRNYLRGLGVTDAAGVARFTTVFPGCYRGRWPHIHLEVFASRAAAASGRAALLTSQVALPEDACRAVYATAGYPGSAAALDNLRLARDGVFRDNDAAAMAAQTLVIGGSGVAGLTGTAVIGLA